MEYEIPAGTTLTLEINEYFLKCLYAKPKIPSKILNYISKQKTINVTNSYNCPLSSVYKFPLRKIHLQSL